MRSTAGLRGQKLQLANRQQKEPPLVHDRGEPSIRGGTNGS